MKIIGIVNKDWANAAWHIFQAFKKYGLDAHLINLQPRTASIKNYVPYYDVCAWLNTKLVKELINKADIYHIFESGDTLDHLQSLALKEKPRLISVNSSTYYFQPEKFYKTIKPYGDIFTTLTMNHPIEELILGLQPLPSNEYVPRKNYSLCNKKYLVVGGAPGHKRQFKYKGFDFLNKKIKHMDIIMHSSQDDVLKRMQKTHDVFTHGFNKFGAYSYTTIQAAMFGIPCFTYTKKRDKNKLLVGGQFPLLDIGPNMENLDSVLDVLSTETERERWGKLTTKWARKYHSYRACYTTYKKIFERMV